MFEEDEQPDQAETDADVLQRLDYYEIRTASRIERLEERIRHLETEFQGLKDSGDVDLRRLRRLGARVFTRGEVEPNEQDNAMPAQKPFPITMRNTSIGLVVLTGIVTAVRSNTDSVSGAELLGRWFLVFLFCAGLPAILAYAVAGRKEQWSRNNRWFFWGSAITALWTIILTIQSAR